MRLDRLLRHIPESNMASSPPKRFLFVFSSGTSSNTLFEILNLPSQSDVCLFNQDRSFFVPPSQLVDQLGLLDRPIQSWSADEKNRIMEAYQDRFTAMEVYTQEAHARGKIAFVTEHGCNLASPPARARFLFGSGGVDESTWRVHVPSMSHLSEDADSRLNETVLPGYVLLYYLPIFLIRHPALAIPDVYRRFVFGRNANSEVMVSLEHKLRAAVTLHWTRVLYNFHVLEDSRNWVCRDDDVDDDVTWPLVLDTDDIVNSPKVIERLCEIVGLDVKNLGWRWQRVSSGDMSENPNSIIWAAKTLPGDTDADNVKTGENLSIGEEAKKWVDEFGEDVGRRIEEWVRSSMPDYEFLRGRKLEAR